MVTYKLDSEEEEKLYYLYYPEGEEDKAPGVIEVYRVKGKVRVTKVAEADFERDIHAGEMHLDEHTDKSEHSVYYGNHAVRNLVDRLNAGEIPKEGCAMWY